VNAGSAGKCRNRAPVAVCKSVTVQSCALTTAASIDGGSSDPDSGDTLTLSQSPAGPYALGTTMVTLTVIDNHGASSQCSGTVTVSNSTSLTVTSLTAKPNVLWPPNDRMVPVTVTASASGCGATAATCKIVSVTSNEPAAGDSTITGDLTVNLRARRSGDGKGRVYTITVRCTDAAGNSTTKTVNVTVPHDQGDKQGDDDDDDEDGQGKGKGKGNGNDDDRGNR